LFSDFFIFGVHPEIFCENVQKLQYLLENTKDFKCGISNMFFGKIPENKFCFVF